MKINTLDLEAYKFEHWYSISSSVWYKLVQEDACLHRTCSCQKETYLAFLISGEKFVFSGAKGGVGYNYG